MKIAVCDDELVAREEIVTCLEDYSVERKLDVDYEVFESYVLLADRIAEFDVFIMDYQTPEIDGMTFAKKIREEFGDGKVIIFVTSFSEIVYDSFLVKTHRFLVKPVDKNKFFEALDSYLLADKNSKKMIIKNDGYTNVFDSSDILYIEACGKESYIYFENEQVVTKKTIASLEDELRGNNFYRIHRTYLVNMKKIKGFDRKCVEMINGEKIEISARKYSAFCKEYLKMK